MLISKWTYFCKNRVQIRKLHSSDKNCSPKVGKTMQPLKKTGLREGKICWAREKLVASWLITLSSKYVWGGLPLSETPLQWNHTIKFQFFNGKQSIKRLRTKYKEMQFITLSMPLLYYWEWEDKQIWRSVNCMSRCPPWLREKGIYVQYKLITFKYANWEL